MYTNLHRIFLSFFGLIITYSFIVQELINHIALIGLMFTIFIGFVWLEFKASKSTFFALPPAYFSLFMFLKIFLSALIFYLFDRKNITQFLVEDKYIVWAVWYTLLAIQVLWITFYSFPSKPIKTFNKLGFISMPIWTVHVSVIIYIIALLVGVQTGHFGYISRAENINYESYIRYGLSFGLLSIIIGTIYHFNSPGARKYLYLLIAINMCTGILSGSKTNVVNPLLIFAFTNYICGRKMGIGVIILFVFGIVLGFSLIEPFRIYYELINRIDVVTIPKLITLFITATEYQYRGEGANYISAFIERFNYITVLGRSIEFADTSGYYVEGEWEHLLKSPLYGVVPRFLWESKPLANFGLWASVNIFDLNATTHTGITPQGYSYLVLRTPGVILFFIMYGIIQRIGYNMFYLNKKLLPVFIYFYFYVLYPSYPTWTAISTYIQASIVIITLLLGLKFINQSPQKRLQ